MSKAVGSPVVLVLVAIAAVQAGSSLAKDLFAAAPPVAVAWLRIATAAVVLLVVARPKLSGRTARDWRPVLGYGLAMVLMNLTFYLAIQRLEIGLVVTIEFLGPLGVAVAGSRRPRDFMWIGLAGLGVALLGFSPVTLDPLGVMFSLLAGAFWAVYIVLAGPTGKSWSGVSGVTVATCVGTLVLAGPAAAVAPEWVGDPRVWLLGIGVGLLSSVIPYALEMTALRTLDRGVFGILMSLEPAAAALFAFLILGEFLRPIEFVAMACVIAASVGATRSRAVT